MKCQSIELLARLRRNATDSPERLAIRDIAGGRTMTWSQLDAAVRDLANRLSGHADSVAMIRCPNSCSFHVAFLGALAAGLTVFPVSHDIAPAEFQTLARRAGASVLIMPDLSINRLETVSPGAVEGAVEGTSPALLLQSSGTTGLPKIARRDAKSLDAVSANMVEAIGIVESDHVLACVPLCHSYGLEHGLLAPLFAGAAVHLAQGFDVATIHSEFAESSITVFPAVPSIYEMLGNFARTQSPPPPTPPPPPRRSAPRIAYSAGGPLPASIFAEIRQSLGIPVAQLYGATEIGSVTFAHPNDPAGFNPDSVGKAMRGVEATVDDTGQLLIRATSMMSSYIADPSPLTADGFFPTGDLARIDNENGNIFITGRLKFLIDVGGLKVNPMEVEQTIVQHSAVGACVVVPIRLSETVFRLKAIVTPADERHPPAGEELRRFVRERLTAYKVPRVFEVRDSLPRSATGKILRHLLLESA